MNIISAIVAFVMAVTSFMPSADPLTKDEADSFRHQISRCWNVGSLSTEALGMSVTVNFDLGRDGKPLRDSIQMASFEDGNARSAKQAFGAARRAIIRCSDWGGERGYDLPQGKYSSWKSNTQVFNPARMRGE